MFAQEATSYWSRATTGGNRSPQKIHAVFSRVKLKTSLHETGTKSNRDENRKFHSMFTWDRYESHKSFNLFTGTKLVQIFQFISLACHFLLLQCFCEHALFRSQEHRRDRSEMYLCWHSSRFEFIPVWRKSVRSSRRNDMRSVWVIFYVNIYYK